MNRTPDVAVVLRAYLADDGLTAPDRVLDVVEERIGRQRQRRSWRLPRRPSMNTYAKLAAGVAAIVFVAIAGWQLLPGSGSGGKPTPSPTSVSTPRPTPTVEPIACENNLTGCTGPFVAGEHRTSNFAPAFRFTTPSGWGNYVALGSIYGLTTSLQRADPILVWSNVQPAQRDAACVLSGTGSASVDDWVGYLTNHPGLVVSNMHQADLHGTPVRILDVAPDPTYEAPCADDRPDRSVPIIKSAIPEGDGYGVGFSSRARIYVVGLETETVIITIYSYSGGDAALTPILAEAEPIVQTFTFEAP